MHEERIIVVEDEPALLETLVYNLEREGYEVKVEGNGLKAFEVAQEMQPDLTLMDIMLPGKESF
jgi:DNA-binding response OmpR family regulator